MILLLVGLSVLVAGGMIAVVSRPSVGAATAAVGSAVALAPAVYVLAGGEPLALRWAWAVPYGAFSLRIDALSALFLLPILVLSGLAAVYGGAYLAPWRGKKPLGLTWLFYNLLVAGMVVVVTAANAVLFLVAWEVMALASFGLVVFEHEKAEVRSAGWTYLVATQLGTAFVLAFFLGLGAHAGSLDFERFRAPAEVAGVLFVLAVIGFGSKAGFMPLHVWLPAAHPAAPSHVSALMSGVMIKTGIYGLLRALTFLGSPATWWGWLLVGVGLASGILGVLFALAQHDLKRLLAYSSVENIGIIVLGIGMSLLGTASGSPMVALFAMTGTLLHVVNHALFKGLLFLGAGSVAHATGTREIDHLGGLLKQMPVTGFAFLIGAASICALPPLNGLVSELLLYVAAYHGAVAADGALAIPALAVLAGLALMGGLAAACFAKAFGAVFLGEARHGVKPAHDAAPAMGVPMLVLAALCVLLGVAAPWGGLITLPAASALVDASGVAGTVQALLRPVTWLAVGTIALVALFFALRAKLLARRSVRTSVTWDCGYAQPAPRMQYTGSSFAQPLVDLFAPLLRTRRQGDPVDGLFPRQAKLSTHTGDAFESALFRPLFFALQWTLGHLRWLQQGRVHLYILYIALTLVVLLVGVLGT